MPDSWYTWEGDDLVIAVYVQPKSSRDQVDGSHGDRLKIRITAAPVDGKANTHLLRFLAKLFGVSRSKITLLSGAGSRAKRIRIEQPHKLPPELTDLSS